ncbi:hypothetical protein F2P81_026088 [Scophthalmus maximus]|uniref:Secreted protein n=1 Tax=Scophthalmus maximus TaxID=52904 RepID=A0A6A4RN30_SCOMX|nr:hypothetical protein F2P81_026088 [Scophthalmus maximus]
MLFLCLFFVSITPVCAPSGPLLSCYLLWHKAPWHNKPPSSIRSHSSFTVTPEHGRRWLFAARLPARYSRAAASFKSIPSKHEYQSTVVHKKQSLDLTQDANEHNKSPVMFHRK